MELISKNAVDKILKTLLKKDNSKGRVSYNKAIQDVQCEIDLLEVEEVDWKEERMKECAFRQVGCKMYNGTILECKGACSWVVDYPKLKELETKKGQ